MDVDKAFEELDRKEQEQIDFGLEAEAFIFNTNKRHIVVTFSETEIKVKPALPRDVALKLAKMQARALKEVKKYENIDEDELTEELFDEVDIFKETEAIAEILSELCLEKPFNMKAFWIHFEQKTDSLSQVFKEIITAIRGSEDKIIEFRKD